MSMNETFYHTLTVGNSRDGSLYRVKKGSCLHMRCDPKLLSETVRVFCNYPHKDDTLIDQVFQFERAKFYLYDWKWPANHLQNDDFDKFIEIELLNAGTFQYYFTINNDGPTCVESAKGGGNIIVEPDLTFIDGTQVNLNCLQVQTVLTKLLGPLDEWDSRLITARNSGYNMFHFTPVEELSKISDSSYSIRDHRRLNSIASKNGQYTYNDLAGQIGRIYKDWNMFSICDLVYNHMSTCSPFLQDVPNAAYNLDNSPFLKPAYVLDRILFYLSKDIQNGAYVNIGISPDELRQHNLDQIRDVLTNRLLPKYRLEEFYQLDRRKTLDAIAERLQKKMDTPRLYKTTQSPPTEILFSKLSIVQDKDYKRLGSTLDFDIVDAIIDACLAHDNNNNVLLCQFEKHLDYLNEQKRVVVADWLNNAVNNCFLNAKYHFFANDGPKYKCIRAHDTPFVPRYFYSPLSSETSVEDDEQRMQTTDEAKFIMAHNGWVLDHDPLVNFCAADSFVFIKRELIPWVDSIKLRYGLKPADCPQLWQYMTEYTQRIARIFHGVRLDNCHNTPLHVAQYYLDIARAVRQDLYVIAELFTNNIQTDNLFVSVLGISSLIRESMSTWNARELSRLLHRYGGDPVGSLFKPKQRPLRQLDAHAIFFDVTHDNQSLIQRHSVYDVLPRSALLLMCGCAYGSTRGFDELVPHEIHVVNEKRSYGKWADELDMNTGIVRAKFALNTLHFTMGMTGYNEIYVDHIDDGDVIAVTRHNPTSHESIVLIAHTAFNNHGNTRFNTFRIPLKVDKILFEAKIQCNTTDVFKRSANYINYLDNVDLLFQDNLFNNPRDLAKSYFIASVDECSSDHDTSSILHFKHFPPGSVLAFHGRLSAVQLESIKCIRDSLRQMDGNDCQRCAIESIVKRLGFDDLNIILYRCSNEEQDENISSDVYVLPNHGPLLFCGLQGIMNVLKSVRSTVTELSHPIFDNLRQGNWLIEYITRRLRAYVQSESRARSSSLLAFVNWLDDVFCHLCRLPRYLIPSYFDMIVTFVYNRLLDQAFVLMMAPPQQPMHLVVHGSSFIRSLALCSIQLVGHVKSAHLPDTIVDCDGDAGLCLSIAAGAPHFSYGIWRNWGRDTFIALRGLLLLTNRYADAKRLILAYGSCLRHGLIPNLLCEGINARYNARDAIWWWLKAIRDYTEVVPDGHLILHAWVYRIYPTDESTYPQNPMELKADSRRMKLLDIMQEALCKHVNGMTFLEANAGPAIDEHMRSEGFYNTIGVQLHTGFVYGGNRYNCGTWMDKMGSSSEANTKGLPSSPRDGSAVELVGLCRYVLEWLIKMYQRGDYPYEGVQLNENHSANSESLKVYTWSIWANRIDANFEKHFWIDANTSQSVHVNHREIYKDTLNSSIPWTDYQLRPNFLIALCLAPSMVNPDNARIALENCRKHLFDNENSMGIKTLDKSDYNYCGFYDNSNRSNDPRISHGYNYHQGPEWLWPIGYYLRSQMLYTANRKETIKHVTHCLARHYKHIINSDWNSLPELTNENGIECQFSCPSQAWSVATILEACLSFTSL